MGRMLAALGLVLVVVGGALLIGAAHAGAASPVRQPREGGRPTPAPSPTPGGITPQIVGGNPADPGEYPWQAAIVVASIANPLNGQYCGGSLIHPNWIVTAAHCVGYLGLYDDPAAVNVVLGVNNLSDGPTNGVQGQRIGVAAFQIHPLYDEYTNDYDIALVRLASPATLNSTVNAIEPAGPGDSALFAPGTMSTVTGWGATAEDEEGSDALLEVQVPIVSNATCNAPSSYDGEVTDNMLCAGLAGGGKDSCYGDSGGPLLVPDGLGGWRLAGITSWGYGCAQPNYYGVYTRVANFANWLDAMVNPPSGIYLPLVVNSAGPCVASPPGESDNISDARTICSGQVVNGQVSRTSGDLDDVYQVWVQHDQQLTITMSGSGGNADLWLYPPGSTDVWTDYAAAVSQSGTNNEFIQATVFSSGYWYVDIYSLSSTTNYSVTATISSP